MSHDRYFINTTATRILDLTQQQIVNYVGNYDYYIEKKEDNEKAQLTAVEKTAAPSQTTTETPAADNKLTWQQQKEEQARLRKIENELKKVEKEIEELEARNEELDAWLSDPANGTNVAKLQEYSKEHEANDNRLEELMEKWEELSE